MNRATCADPPCPRLARALGLGSLDPARLWACARHTRGTCRPTCQVVHPQSKLRLLWAQVWGRRALGTGWKGKPPPHHLPAPQKTLSQPGLPSTCTAPSGNEKMKGAYLPGPVGGCWPGRTGVYRFSSTFLLDPAANLLPPAEIIPQRKMQPASAPWVMSGPLWDSFGSLTSHNVTWGHAACLGPQGESGPNPHTAARTLPDSPGRRAGQQRELVKPCPPGRLFSKVVDLFFFKWKK